jgi:hypothetical protein
MMQTSRNNPDNTQRHELRTQMYANMYTCEMLFKAWKTYEYETIWTRLCCKGYLRLVDIPKPTL